MTPADTTTITLQSAMVDKRWAIEKDVRPSLAVSRARCTTCSLCVSKALVASSKRSTGGFRISALQMATRCFWPPESLDPRGPTSVSYFLGSLSKNARFAIFAHFSNHSSETSSPSSMP
mmetsp:Transcript_33968/g.79439  ORF Transcript_33968/g.79439 Transcript_33968/m.79439 type:complete len:119 (+) Transcript_33968:293-649(+)